MNAGTLSEGYTRGHEGVTRRYLRQDWVSPNYTFCRQSEIDLDIVGEVERKLAAARAAQEADSSKENSRGSDSHAPGQHKSASSSEHEKSIYTDELNATRNSGTPQRQGPSSDGDCFRGLNAQNDHQRAAGQVAQQPAPPEQMQREL